MNPRKWIKSSGMPVIPWDHVPASQSPYALLLLSGKQLVFWKTAQNLQMTWMLVSFSAKPFLTTHPLIPNQVFRCPFLTSTDQCTCPTCPQICYLSNSVVVICSVPTSDRGHLVAGLHLLLGRSSNAVEWVKFGWVGTRVQHF